MDDRNYACTKCSAVYKSRGGLYKHVKKSHPENSEKDVAKGSKCGLCASRFYGQKALCAHLIKSHDIDASVSTLQFNNTTDYEHWLSTVEKEGHFRFVQKTFNKSKYVQTMKLLCHRSGYFKSKSANIRAPRPLTTNKVGFTCSAFANVKTSVANEGAINVECCLTHYGHDDLVQRLPLGKEREQRLVQMVEDGWTTEKIIEHERGDVVVDENGQFTLQRHNLISKENIYFIRSKYHLNPGQKADDDQTSVALWIEDLREKGMLLCHSSQPEQFYIGIQTDFQRAVLRRCTQTVCIDSTHGTNRNGYLLTTLLVVGDAGKGIPVGWFITSSESEDSLVPFFDSIRKQAGSLKPSFFMSDDYPAYFKAWSRVFDTTETKKILCSWHVRSNWAKNLNSKFKSDGSNMAKFQKNFINYFLKSLASEIDEQSFNDKLDLFTQLLRSMNQHEFELYFRTYYCSVERRKEWAMWARKSSTVNTNMFLEAYHRKLKYSPVYLNKRSNCRLDFLIYTLTKLAVEYHNRFLIDRHSVVPSSYRLSVMNDRHRKSYQLSDSDISVVVVGKEWRCKSNVSSCVFYTIRSQDHECLCLLKCRYCKVCPIAYNCTCMDAQIVKTACKHVHFIHSQLNPSPPIESSYVIKKMPPSFPQDCLSSERNFDYDAKLNQIFGKLKNCDSARIDNVVGKQIVHILEDAVKYASCHSSTSKSLFQRNECRKRRVEPQARFFKKDKKSKRQRFSFDEQRIAKNAIDESVVKFKTVLRK